MRWLAVALVTVLPLVGVASAAEGERAATAAPPTYLLRYKFHPNQTLRWDVSHQTSVRSNVGGTSQEAETYTTSVKAWQFQQIDAEGQATFEHRVENVDMRQKLEGRPPVRYNSRTDKTPPPGFEQVAKSVGVPLVVVTMDSLGKISKRKRNAGATSPHGDTQMTMPLPEEAIPVGHTWTVPNEVDVRSPSGTVRRIKVEQRFTLEEVRTGVATIAVQTQVLTPVRDPAIEAQIAQHESTGKIRFDIDRGCILWQQIDRDKRVVGFQGETSSMHYLSRFVETLQPVETKVATKTDARPQ